jgi:hypothetical protein
MSTTGQQAHSTRPRISRYLIRIIQVFIWLILAILSIWALAALYIDLRISWLRIPFAVIYAVVLAAIVMRFRLRIEAALLFLVCFVVVLAWWLSLKPSNTGNWQQDVDRPAWAEINQDRVTIHNFRNCDYRTETDYSHCWSDRTVNLSDLRGVDLFFTTWGVRWIGHPIVSFQFGNDQHIAFSIEARYTEGQDYSAILGFFRQYPLIFVVADERDVIRLRTNYRKDEEVFLYRTTIGLGSAHAVFETYIDYLNKLKDNPEWYNAATRNCTTTLEKPISEEVTNPQRWNYQLLVNGTLDELLYDRGRLVTDGLPFQELKSRAHINATAKAAGDSPDFSALIRAGRPGFENEK